jgi:hypothetical protein
MRKVGIDVPFFQKESTYITTSNYTTITCVDE